MNIDNMTDDAKRVKIAEACGWKTVFWHRGYKSATGVKPGQAGNNRSPIPNYLNDLNAMHEAERKLSLEQRDTYQQQLYRVCEREHRMATIYWLVINSTAKQRADAFLLCLP